MASERQIAANRRNAAKSTGPRSTAGKKRTAQNAVRHGLFLVATRYSALAEVEVLAHALAGEGADDAVLAQARCAAQAYIELNRARRTKLALIERVESFGSLKVPRVFSTARGEVRWHATMLNRLERGLPPEQPNPEDFLGSMPASGSERTIEAMRRALPELAKLASYEKRAAARRDQAIRLLVGLK